MLLGSIKTGTGRLGNSSPDMTAVFHFLLDLALVKLEHSQMS